MKINKTTLNDILAVFCNRESLSNTNLINKPTVFVSSLGFEDRSSAIFRSLAASGLLQETTCIVLVYSTNRNDNEKTKPLFEEFKGRVKNLIYVPYRRGRLCSDLKSKIPDNPEHIMIDISTLSSYCFYPLFYELFHHFLTSELSVVYAEAKTYQPSLEEWTAFLEKVKAEKEQRTSLFESWDKIYFQTTEVDQVYESELFQGINPDPLPDALIAIPNFATVRMRTFITRFQETPGSAKDKIFWILGTPPAEDKKWRLEALKGLHDVKEPHEACTLDYKDIWHRLESIWQKEHLDYHLTIATLGSKMQHLGTFFFLLAHPEVTLLLSEPKEYIAKRYSEDVGDRWLLNFGEIEKLKNHLKSSGFLEVL